MPITILPLQEPDEERKKELTALQEKPYKELDEDDQTRRTVLEIHANFWNCEC